MAATTSLSLSYLLSSNSPVGSSKSFLKNVTSTLNTVNSTLSTVSLPSNAKLSSVNVVGSLALGVLQPYSSTGALPVVDVSVTVDYNDADKMWKNGKVIEKVVAVSKVVKEALLPISKSIRVVPLKGTDNQIPTLLIAPTLPDNVKKSKQFLVRILFFTDDSNKIKINRLYPTIKNCESPTLINSTASSTSTINNTEPTPNYNNNISIIQDASSHYTDMNKLCKHQNANNNLPSCDVGSGNNNVTITSPFNNPNTSTPSMQLCGDLIMLLKTFLSGYGLYVASERASCSMNCSLRDRQVSRRIATCCLCVYRCRSFS